MHFVTKKPLTAFEPGTFGLIVRCVYDVGTRESEINEYQSISRKIFAVQTNKLLALFKIHSKPFITFFYLVR